jgi:hypothetical protein
MPIGDPQLCHRMGNAVRAKAERELGLDRLVFETLEFIREQVCRMSNDVQLWTVGKHIGELCGP